MTGEADLQRKARPTSAQTLCPFCEGRIVLDVDAADRTRDDVLARFAGSRATCPHSGCGREFFVRRREISVRMK